MILRAVVKGRGVSRPSPSCCSLCWECLIEKVFCLGCKQSRERAGLWGKWVWKFWMYEFLSSGGKTGTFWHGDPVDEVFSVVPSAEACPVFYGVFSTLILGSKTLLNTTLDFVAATDEEKAALGKIQDCYNEAGIDDKVLDLLLMVIYPSLTPTLRIHMRHSVMCHTVIDHAVMGYVTEKTYEQRSTIKPLLQCASPIICKHNPPAHPASRYQTCSYHAN